MSLSKLLKVGSVNETTCKKFEIDLVENEKGYLKQVSPDKVLDFSQTSRSELNCTFAIDQIIDSRVSSAKSENMLVLF